MSILKDVNLLGVWSLYLKEVKRFLKVYNQTIFAPLINTLLFLAIFSLALGKNVHQVNGIRFVEFMSSGLVMMAVMQNAFANSSSSLVMGKVMGTIVDYLMPPISAFEMIFGMVMAAVTRALIVGLLVVLAVNLFVDLTFYSIGLMFLMIFLAALLLGILGLLAGVFAETFDQMAAINSYVIVPLTFLSGTFYSVKNLPEFWYNISKFNPFFYIIDIFRYATSGVSDGNVVFGLVYIVSIIVVLWVLLYVLISSGHRLKN